MFTATLFAMADRWKEPKCLSTDKWINQWGIYGQWNVIQPLKEGSSDTCYMDEPQRLYAKQNKPITKNQMNKQTKWAQSQPLLKAEAQCRPRRNDT